MLNRRLLMAQGSMPPSPGIVTDGLIFRLNGLDRGPAGHWIDEIGGIDFTLSNVIETPTGVEFKGIKDSRGTGKGNGQAFRIADTGTIEVAINLKKKKSAYLVFAPNQLSGIILYGAYGGSILHGERASKQIAYKADTNIGPRTVSVSNALGMRNQAILPTSAKDYFSGDINFLIGTNDNGSYAFPGVLHEVRVYNRQLTEAEILQNQQYDIDTYFGGVIPE